MPRKIHGILDIKSPPEPGEREASTPVTRLATLAYHFKLR